MTINLTFWLILALSASVIANFVAFYYIRLLLGRLLYLGDNLSDLTEMITSYRNHLKSVYEMEMFYGDETLKYLIEHTRSLHNMLEEYEDVYIIAIPPESTEQIINNTKEIEQDAKTTITEQNVFYAGTRKGDN